MAAARGVISVRLDQRSYDRAMARLAKYEGKPFKTRMEAAFLAGTRLAVAPMRRVAPRRTGLLASRVSMRKGQPDTGYIVRAGTKSRAPHSGLITRGHRIVTRGGVDTGQRTQPHPFTNEVIAAHEGRIVDFISKATASEDVGVRSFGGL